MARGLVTTANHSIDAGGRWEIRGPIGNADLRHYLTYWDRIVHVVGNGIGVNDSDYDPYTLLKDEGILSVMRCDVQVEVDPADRDSDQHINGIPMEYWGPIFFYQRRAVAVHLNDIRHSDCLWSIGEIGMDSILAFEGASVDALDLELVRALPVPSEDTPLEEILEFKARRAAELIRFRSAMDALGEAVTTAENTHSALVRAREELDLALFDLHRVLDETKMQKVVGTVRTVLGFEESQPMKYGIAALAGITGGALALHLELFLLAGLGVTGVINLVARRTPKELTLPDELRDFVYLYRVQKEL